MKASGSDQGTGLTHRRVKSVGISLFTLIICLGLLLALPGVRPASAANPAPVQIYYVTLPENDVLTALDTINSDANTPITTYFSISIGVTDTLVYYDQWENGYDSDIANPTNLYSAGNLGGTQIWGNRRAADGCPPNKAGVAVICDDANDVLNAGDVIIPNNSMPVPRNSNNIYFDGKDKVGASRSISMARLAWASGSGTLMALGHEMYSTSEWGTAYEAPVGCDTANMNAMFEYSALSIMAAQNGTPIRVDADGNGTWDYTGTLNEGGSYFESFRSRTGCDYVRQGARVESTDAAKPIQVVLITGDIGSTYASRDFNLLPTKVYGGSYWSPVGVDTTGSGPTRLYLYNPSANSSIYVTCERSGVANITVGPIAARGNNSAIELINNQGARCYSSTSNGTATNTPFYAIGVVDAEGIANDWGFNMYPDNFLSTEALVGLGLGRDPTSGTSQSQNGGPLWVTAACSSGGTYVYVDWNNDGTADLIDLNGDGDTTDNNVDGIANLDEPGSNNGLLVNRLQSVRLFEPPLDTEPFDQSGARVWSRTASSVGYGGTPGCNLVLGWGQDPRTASGGAPGLDAGTMVPPLRSFEGTKNLTLKTDNDGDGQLSPGDVATYNLSFKNTGAITIPSVYVFDTVPANTTYAASSTAKDLTSNNGTGPWVAIPDAPNPGDLPLSVPGGVLLGNLTPGATFFVRFDVTLNNNFDYNQITNCDTYFTGAGNLENCATDLVVSKDWGDLPDTYGTSLAADGPRHSPSSLILGALIDREPQGIPTSGANGDDLNQTDDEDGVEIGPQTPWSQGTGVFLVTVANGPGCLNAWMDFTNDTGSGAGVTFSDGNFTKTGGYDTVTASGTAYSEYIIQNMLVNSGTSELYAAVPPGLVGGSNLYYFRFRLSPPDPGTGLCSSAIAPTGLVVGGEIEDYQFNLSSYPTAITVSDPLASAVDQTIVVDWQTFSEMDILGFNLYRATALDSDKTLIYQVPARHRGELLGDSYQYTDGDVQAGVLYTYWLDVFLKDGTMTTMAPTSASLMPSGLKVFLPVVVR